VGRTSARSLAARGDAREAPRVGPPAHDPPRVGPPADDDSLRLGTERSMAATLAVAASLLVLPALPDFTADHLPGMTPLVVVSLFLGGSMLAALPLALLRRPGPVRAGLWWLPGSHPEEASVDHIRRLPSAAPRPLLSQIIDKCHHWLSC